MRTYYLSRAFVALAFGGLWLASGSSWLAAGLAAGVAFGLSLLAPRSGLYAVHPERGATALVADERTRAVQDKAARIAFQVTILALAALEVYFRSAGLEAFPFAAVNYLLLLGVAVYVFFRLYLLRA
jgi:uncharacterized membrane protein